MAATSLIVVFLISLLMFLWYKNRYPIREHYFDKLRSESIKKTSAGIRGLMDELILPLTTSKVRIEMLEKMLRISSKEEYEAFLKENRKQIKTLESEIKDLEAGNDAKSKFRSGAERATEAILDSFLSNLQHEARESYNKAYKKPLNEKYAKLKNKLDQIVFMMKINTFVVACIILTFAIIIKLISE